MLDTQAGEHFPAHVVIGTDYVGLVQKRMAVRESLRTVPLYRCALCNGPVFLSSEKTKSRYFFKHRHQPDSCPAMTRGALNQDDIRALKYNGAKESAKHRQMKAWLAEALEADGRFTNIEVEKNWQGTLLKEWRRPDVRAEFQGVRIAFEVQLSTTFLDVIAQRRSFYLREGGLLFWVFGKFDLESARMTEEDVFYNNNLNAFVVNEKTTAHSKQRSRFHLGCYWAEPEPDGEPGPLKKKLVSFDGLTQDLPRQRVFFFDFEEAREAPRKALRAEIEAWFRPAGAYYQPGGRAQWNAFVRRLQAMRVEIPEGLSTTHLRLIEALYSVKNGKPWGSRLKTFVQLVHNALQAPSDTLWVQHAIEKYGRHEQAHAEGSPGKLAAKLARLREARAGHPELYEPDRTPQALVEFLFPELLPLPRSWPSDS